MRISRRALVAALVIADLSACSSDRVTSSSGRDVPPQTTDTSHTTAHDPTDFPSRDGYTADYEWTSSSSAAGRSHYVLLPGGNFVAEQLRPDAPAGRALSSYPGRYTRVDSVVRFEFLAGGPAAPWTAAAVLRHDTLRVQHSQQALSAGLEDGVYVISPKNESIFLASAADSGVSTLLTRGGWPAWSPDARRIAFERGGHVCVIDADGANGSCVAEGAWPAWSPDGKRIAFVNSDGIAVMNADGSDVTTLIGHHFRTDVWAPGDLGVGKPAWSPDGQHIAFEHLGDGDLTPPEVFVMDLDGSHARMLCADCQSDPVWSSDGATLFFWSYRYGLASATLQDTLPKTILYDFPAIAYGARPAPSPDRRALAYVVSGRSERTVETVPLAGSATPTAFQKGYEPAWSPDGIRIAVVRFAP